MRIALATLEYPTEPYRAGGMCWAFAKIARGLKSRGHEVTVVVPAEESGCVSDEVGIPVQRYRVQSHLSSRLEAALSWRLPIGVTHYQHAWSLYYALDRLDREKPLDLVLAVASPESFVAAGSRRWRYVSRVSAYRLFIVISNFFSVTNGYLFEDWMKIRACAWADARYAPSRILARVFERLGCGSTSVVQTPMNPLALSPSPVPASVPAGRFLLFYGSLQGTKGAHHLADVAGPLLETHPDLHLVFIGRDLSAPGFGSMRSYIEKTLARQSDRVHILGVMEQADALRVMARAEWVLFPSVMDNLPNALLEAMYLERPVLVTRNSGTDELIQDGINGLVVDSNQADALRAGLERALACGSEERGRMGAAARETVLRECDPDKAAAALECLLSEVARRPLGGRNQRWRVALRLWWIHLAWLGQVARFIRCGAPRHMRERLQAMCREYLPMCQLQFKD